MHEGVSHLLQEEQKTYLLLDNKQSGLLLCLGLLLL